MTRSAIVLLVLGLAGSASAWAQPAPATTHEAEARAHFERGTAHYKDGRYLEARAEFAAGYELSHRPMFLFNMAECSRLRGDLDIARDTYERYLRADPNGSNAELARQRLTALGAKVNEPVKEDPPAVAKPDKPERPVVIKPVVAEPTPSPVTRPAPTPTPECAEGSSCWASSRGRTKRLVGLGVGGAGIALAATGIYFWRRSVSLGSDVTEACEIGCDWEGVKDTYAASQSAATKQWVFLGLGSAAIVTGGVLYFLGSRERNASRVVVVPTADGAAVSWSGAW
jgi:hypothetical protein